VCTRGGRWDRSSAAQARGIGDKLKQHGGSDADRTERAREDDEKLKNGDN
jgi:hypothetical protein